VSILFQIIFLILRLFEIALLGRVILSWFPNIDRSNPLIQFLFDVTEPVLKPVREMLPQTGLFDFSPLVVFLVIQVLMSVLSTAVRF
jgi:YggT family protein